MGQAETKFEALQASDYYSASVRRNGQRSPESAILTFVESVLPGGLQAPYRSRGTKAARPLANAERGYGGEDSVRQ